MVGLSLAVGAFADKNGVFLAHKKVTRASDTHKQGIGGCLVKVQNLAAILALKMQVVAAVLVCGNTVEKRASLACAFVDLLLDRKSVV